MLWEFGTNSVQLRERKNGFLVPKRHRMKHLDFFEFLVGIQEVGGSNPLAPTHLSSTIYAAFADADFWTIFGTFGSTEGTRCVSPRNGSLEQNAGRFIGS